MYPHSNCGTSSYCKIKFGTDDIKSFCFCLSYFLLPISVWHLCDISCHLTWDSRMFCLVEFRSVACDAPIWWQLGTWILPSLYTAVTTEPLASFPSSSVAGFVARWMALVAAYLEDSLTPGHRPSFLGVYVVSPKKMLWYYDKYDMTVCFRILSNSSFSYHLTYKLLRRKKRAIPSPFLFYALQSCPLSCSASPLCSAYLTSVSCTKQ